MLRIEPIVSLRTKGVWIELSLSFLMVMVFSAGPIMAEGAGGSAVEEFETGIKPLLEQYCYDCHGEGASKGEISLDDPVKGAHKMDNQELWLEV